MNAKKDKRLVILSQLARYSSLLFLFLWYSAACPARAILIDHADLALKDDIYHLNARLQLRLGDGAAYQALVHGIALYLHIKMRIKQDRAWLWDKTMMDRLLIFRLQYYSLTEEYVVTNVNTGKKHSFKTLEHALNDMGNIKDLPFFDKILLSQGNAYNVTMKAFIDIESLPIPMRPIAYISAEWRALSSMLYSWTLTP